MALIISENYLKEMSIINGNTDMKLLTPTIRLCQDKYVKPILGSDLFDEIIGEIPTLSSANQTLMDDYILPAMLLYVVSEAAPVFKYRYANRGLMVNTSDHANQADFNEMRWLMDKWKNDAEWYAEQATKFLMENSNDYPLYYNGNTTCDKIKPNKTNYRTGINLD